MTRFLIFLLSSFLLAVLQSTLVSWLFPSYLQPDLMLLLVTFLGVAFPLLPGALLVAFCGLLCDTFSGGSLGLFTFIYLCIFFSLKALAKFLILGEALTFRIILVAILMGFQTFLLLFLSLSMGITSHLSWPFAGWILPQLMVTCAACWPLFYLFRKLDVPPTEEASPSIP